MKKILVLTDFSAYAEHAALYAAMLASQLRADILLQHAYANESAMPLLAGVPVGGSYLDIDWEEKLDSLAEKLRLSISGLFPGIRPPRISVQNTLGNVRTVAENAAQGRGVILTVMGRPAGSPLEYFLTGNDTRTLFDHVPGPLLIVPARTPLAPLSKVLFATNYSTEDMIVLRRLVTLASILRFEILLAHVQVSGKDYHEESLQSLFIQLASDFGKRVKLVQARARSIQAGLQTLCREHDASALAIVHRQRSLLERTLGQSTTRAVSARLKLPLFVFPQTHY